MNMNNLMNGNNYPIKVKVDNRDVKEIYYWSIDKFMHRYDLFRDLLEKYFETSSIPSLKLIEDPFWDPKEAICIG